MRLTSLYILIVFSPIPILAVLAYFQFRAAFSAMPNDAASQIDLPKIENSANNLRIGENTSYLDFTDPDGKLKIRYGSSWIKADENAVENSKSVIDPEKEELLLLLYKVDLAKLQPSYLVIERLNTNSWDEILGTMQKDAEANGQTMEIVKSDLAGGRISLEIKYEPKDKTGAKAVQFMRQREEIFIDGDKSYVLSVVTGEQNWPLIQQETEDIFNSAGFAGKPLESAPVENNMPKPEPIR